MAGPSLQKLIFMLFVSMAGLSVVSAHMDFQFPPSIKSAKNDFSWEEIDYESAYPLNIDGSNFPCHGHATEENITKYKSVATVKAGQKFKVTFAQDGDLSQVKHKGGSCQYSVSYDGGKNFVVIHSVIGGCPLPVEYSVPVPSDLPSAEKALFAWTWFNNEGFREMYMSCAIVDIESDSTGSFTGPAIFRANIFGGKDLHNPVCGTTEYETVIFPNPGPSVHYESDDLKNASVTKLRDCDIDLNNDYDVMISSGAVRKANSNKAVSKDDLVATEEGSDKQAALQINSSTKNNFESVFEQDVAQQVPEEKDATKEAFAAEAPESTEPTKFTEESTNAATTEVATTTIAAEPTKPTIDLDKVFRKCLSSKHYIMCYRENCTTEIQVEEGRECVHDKLVDASRRKRSHRRTRRSGRRIGGYRLK